MLDAQPDAAASTRAPLALSISPQPTPRPSSKPAAMLAAARALQPILESGTALDAPILRKTMTDAFGADDTEGAWIWKDCYDTVEAALVLFIQRYGRAMRLQAGRGDHGPAAMLDMLNTIAALEPSQTRRSQEQQQLQQFSTPLPLAYAALQAAALRPTDVVLEPSAGTGMLAVMAQCALGKDNPEALLLNEIAPTRAALLSSLFPGSPVTTHNAETIRDRLPDARPTVILMNPPFSVTPGITSPRHDADLRHIRSAFAMLPPGGRLVTISSAHCSPSHSTWSDAFRLLDPPARVLFTAPIDGRVYARRGTGFDTRLTVIERGGPERELPSPSPKAQDAGHLLQLLSPSLPYRLPIQPIPGTDLFGGTPSPRPASRRPKTNRTPTPSTPHEWKNIHELHYEIADKTASAADTHGTSGPYDEWRPCTIHIPLASEHPTTLVQSTAMAAVPHPTPSYRPILPESVVTGNALSDAQLESVVLAGQAHLRHLSAEYRIGSQWETLQRVDLAKDDASEDTDNTDPQDSTPDDSYETLVSSPNHTADGELLSQPVQFRQGWMLGDGTGVGKGREVAAVILDNWLRGRTRALWLSQSDKLLEDTRRDWIALGGRKEDVHPLSRIRQSDPIPHDHGILFTTYATLRSAARQNNPSRLEQIVAWLAEGEDDETRHAFQGVIVFDEAHAMANAAGTKTERGDSKPSQQGRAGLRLQNALPNARILYVSATGATTVPGLAYATRLGLWGSDTTPFETRVEFVCAMEAGGVAAMEVVARDLKALGLYQARALSYHGVQVDILEHPLSDEQRRIYDSYADAFKIIHANIQEALKATGIVDGEETLNTRAKSAALSAFESAKQRFFGHLLTSMKCPTLIRSIESDIEHGHSSVVQLVSTGEALMERRIADIPASEWDDLSIDLTPREYVLDFLAHAFPIQLQEPFEDDDGNVMSRPVFDSNNNPVLCQEAVQRRDKLIQKLGSLPPVPAALDQIMQHFGHEAVAEITGRSRRILRINDAKGERLALRPRPASANLAETASFMDGSKRILVFSMAGGTGRSYHADISAENSQRRIHYLLEAGWRADQAIQGLGRTHRTHQACPPLFRPITTDVKGERRFIATIARRLDSLGAITRGQRNSQTAMGDDTALFKASDNLESPYARAALRQFYGALWTGKIDDWSVEQFQQATGLKITYEGGLKEDLPPMPQFLNRLLALPIDEQNQLFSALETRIDSNIENAIEAGVYERGVETIRADSLILPYRETVYTHDTSGGETEIVEIVRRDKLQPLAADDALRIYYNEESSARLIVNNQSKRAAITVPAVSRMIEDGGVQKRVRLVKPAIKETMPHDALESSQWHDVLEPYWRSCWNDELTALPSHRESRFWLVTGLLLPIWDRLPEESMRVRRLVTDDGQHLIGRVLGPTEVHNFRGALGLDNASILTPDEIHDEILNRYASFELTNSWKLSRRRIMGADRIEIHGPTDHDLETLKRMGCIAEVISWATRIFAPNRDAIDKIIERWPIATIQST